MGKFDTECDLFRVCDVRGTTGVDILAHLVDVEYRNDVIRRWRLSVFTDDQGDTLKKKMRPHPSCIHLFICGDCCVHGLKNGLPTSLSSQDDEPTSKRWFVVLR